VPQIGMISGLLGEDCLPLAVGRIVVTLRYTDPERLSMLIFVHFLRSSCTSPLQLIKDV